VSRPWDTGRRVTDGPDLLARLAALPPAERDAEVERYLGIAEGADSTAPGAGLIGYHASGVAPIIHALVEVPVGRDDVVVDLGAGLGKVVLLASLLTGARSRGIELQPALVQRARSAAARLGVPVEIAQGDVRDAPLEDGTVFFLYAPFHGPVLRDVFGRLRAVASRRAIVVCALGVDLGREAPWLVPRPIDSFWLSIYDSRVEGASPRDLSGERPSVGPEALAVALERRLKTFR
jgi:SAM-dependent methyltransferase